MTPAGSGTARLHVLVACEYSGIVRDAFRALGHDAWSCDIIATEKPGPHILNDVRNVLDWDWDLMIAHPPCQYVSYAGNRWLKQPDRWRKIFEAMDFFRLLLDAPIPKIAIENPRGWTWKYIRSPDQIIEPYHFGHPMTKATCLWLKGLPKLTHTHTVLNPEINWTRNKKGSHSAHDRARTFQGIADAMAAQWSQPTAMQMPLFTEAA